MAKELKHNEKLCYNAIKNAWNGKAKVLKVDYPKYGNMECLTIGGVTRFTMNGYSKYNLREDFRKAVDALRKEEGYEKCHLICNTNSDNRMGVVVKISFKDYKREKLQEGEQIYLVESWDIWNCNKDFCRSMAKKYMAKGYELKLRSGFAFRGASTRPNQTLDALEKELSWACTEDLEIDHGKKTILVNGFSANDMW